MSREAKKLIIIEDVPIEQRDFTQGEATQLYKNLAKHHLHGEKHCPNEFETSYAPDRPEIIYCEKCYQQEVY